MLFITCRRLENNGLDNFYTTYQTIDKFRKQKSKFEIPLAITKIIKYLHFTSCTVWKSYFNASHQSKLIVEVTFKCCFLTLQRLLHRKNIKFLPRISEKSQSLAMASFWKPGKTKPNSIKKEVCNFIETVNNNKIFRSLWKQPTKDRGGHASFFHFSSNFPCYFKRHLEVYRYKFIKHASSR